MPKKLRYVTEETARGGVTAVKPAQRGRKPTYQILRYRAKLGDGSFVITGNKPVCAVCDSENLTPCVEITQLVLGGGDDISLVMQCGDCGQHSVFKYELWGE